MSSANGARKPKERADAHLARSIRVFDERFQKRLAFGSSADQTRVMHAVVAKPL